MDAMFTNGASAIGVCTITALWNIPMAGMNLLMLVHGPHQECTKLQPPLRVASCYQSTVLQPFNPYDGEYTFGDSAESPNSYMTGKGQLFRFCSSH